MAVGSFAAGDEAHPRARPLMNIVYRFVGRESGQLFVPGVRPQPSVERGKPGAGALQGLPLFGILNSSTKLQ